MPYTMDDELPDYADMQISDMEKGIADRLLDDWTEEDGRRIEEIFAAGPPEWVMELREELAAEQREAQRSRLGSHAELMALYREMDEAERYD